MPTFTVRLRGPDGKEYHQDFEGPDEQTVLSQLGVKTPQAPQQAQASGSEALPALLSTAGQIGLPLLATALAPGTGGATLLGLGLLGGLGGAALGRGGMFSAGDVGATVAGEAFPGGQLFRGARTLLPKLTGRVLGRGALGEGIPRLAERAGVRLTPGETFPGGFFRGTTEAPERMATEQAVAVTGAIGREGRAAGARPTSLPKFLDDWHRHIAQIAEHTPDRAGPVLAEARRALGTDARQLTVPTLQRLIRSRDIGPAGIVSALKSLGIPGAEGRMAEIWWSDVLQTSAREAQPGSRLYPNLYQGAGGTFFLDGDAVVKAVRGLTPHSLASFGAPRRQALSELATVLERARSAQKALPRVAGAPISGKRGIVPLNTLMSALKESIRHHPIIATSIGLGEASSLFEPEGGRLKRFTRVGEFAGAFIGGRYVGQRILSRLLSTDAGMRWVAAGVEMQNRGMPANMVISSLSRLAGQTLARSEGGAVESPQGGTLP